MLRSYVIAAALWLMVVGLGAHVLGGAVAGVLSAWSAALGAAGGG